MKTLCFLSKTPSPSIVSVALAPSTPHRESMTDMCIASAASIISKWNPETSAYARITSIFYEDKSEAMYFLKCVTDLQSSMHSLVSSNSSSDKLIEAQALMQVAMKILQKEFYQVLSTNSAHLNPESVSAWWSSSSSRASTSSDNQDQGSAKYAGEIMSHVLPVPMADLRSIAECMISSGYTKECLHIYMMARKSVIDEGIHRLGIERMSSLKINKMNWEATELRITNWLAGLKVAIGTLFTGERILCDHVFASSDSIREFCFAGISTQGATILFAFPENIAVKSKKFNGNEMFRILDMYKTITESWQEIEFIFSYESTSAVLSQAMALLSKLGESVRGFISGFEANLRKDSSKTLVPGGGVHPLTVHAMNHLSFLTDYSIILNDILAYGTPPVKIWLADESYFDSSESYDSQSQAISLHFTKILLVLLCKLDSKAKHYKDLSLSYLFLANNMQHVVSRVRTSNIRCLLSDKWVTNHETKVRQFAEKHQGLAWGKVMGSFPENPTALVSAEEAREYFKRFNMHFNVACRKQRSFVVSDPGLGKEIKMAIARRVVPVYRQLYDTHRYRNLDSLARLTPEDVLDHISNILLETAA